jgi:hypothetical protein
MQQEAELAMLIDEKKGQQLDSQLKQMAVMFQSKGGKLGY